MQNDYGDLVETPEHVRQIAHAVALAIREQERPFWISREQHHAQHMHLATLMDVAAADNVRRQWVDMQIQRELDAQADRRDIKKKIIGAVSVAGLLYLFAQVGDSVVQFFQHLGR